MRWREGKIHKILFLKSEALNGENNIKIHYSRLHYDVKFLLLKQDTFLSLTL
jgi:hypothetical protein